MCRSRCLRATAQMASEPPASERLPFQTFEKKDFRAFGCELKQQKKVGTIHEEIQGEFFKPPPTHINEKVTHKTNPRRHGANWLLVWGAAAALGHPSL